MIGAKNNSDSLVLFDSWVQSYLIKIKSNSLWNVFSKNLCVYTTHSFLMLYNRKGFIVFSDISFCCFFDCKASSRTMLTLRFTLSLCLIVSRLFLYYIIRMVSHTDHAVLTELWLIHHFGISTCCCLLFPIRNCARTFVDKALSRELNRL